MFLFWCISAETSGKYEDDFEELGSDDDDDEWGSSDTEGVGESVGSSTSSLNTPRRQKISYLKRMAIANRDNTLTLTLRDVHVSRNMKACHNFHA